jgi:hypothetical protein
MKRLDAPTWFAVVYTAIMVPLIAGLIVCIAVIWQVMS